MPLQRPVSWRRAGRALPALQPCGGQPHLPPMPGRSRLRKYPGFLPSAPAQHGKARGHPRSTPRHITLQSATATGVVSALRIGRRWSGRNQWPWHPHNQRGHCSSPTQPHVACRRGGMVTTTAQ
eukprot:CAMPEP_0204532576 /NCGR_PEP_ID=MMETSP0661-20131031/11803_1 /ASSEMBLY_ACC=CAM_ASM_000606 /TAXON_ID=109239 /ORGANISM="Alexandrium margalefi, Strain AMGDE01CS-322" /LENGTH=123 /DNA_ID=CAMNT_0051538833 /DNA_START=171 /DNA_END=542 /DNA_ORIENTATION=+